MRTTDQDQSTAAVDDVSDDFEPPSKKLVRKFDLRLLRILMALVYHVLCGPHQNL
jgi:hypothetical protein